jgi:hypothetical protein
MATVVLGTALAWERGARAEDAGTAARVTPAMAVGIWTGMQLVPSPLFVVGTGNASVGFRWQVTPIAYSFGVAAKPVRAFIVEPVARHTGAIELYLSPEWACCAEKGTSWIGRGGLRLYLPLAGRGESLSGSLGASYYRASDGDGASAEIGAYTLFGILGLTLTFSPKLTGRETMLALALRYF